MDSAIRQAANAGTVLAPDVIFNCPHCSHYLPEGTLACPECQTIIYSDHLRTIATNATSEETAGKWSEAREMWKQALLWLPEGSKQYVAVEQRIALVDSRLKAAEDNKAKWTRRLGPLAPVVYFLAKFKTFFLLLTKAKFLLSFAGFFALYWAIFGWKFALGFTLGILVHEMGHYVEAKRRGLKVDLPVFLPGLGAYVRWYSMGVSLETLSSIALAGPTFGMFFAIFCAAMARLTGEPQDTGGIWTALAHVTAWLNILNLIPVLGLDGAQATYALDRTQRWLILATSIIFFAIVQEWPFLLVGIGMAWRLWQGGPAEKPSTRTLVQFVLILFVLGVVMYVFPDPTRRPY